MQRQISEHGGNKGANVEGDICKYLSPTKTGS